MIKLGFLFTEIFWGALLILIGLTTILKTILGIDIPILKILFALLLIYSGFTIITGLGKSPQKKQTIAFQEKTVQSDKADGAYTIMFGKGIVDATSRINQGKTQTLKVNVMFGSGILKINNAIPTKIITNSAFANVHMPNEDNTVFVGGYTYNTNPQSEPAILVEANVVFGDLKIISV